MSRVLLALLAVTTMAALEVTLDGPDVPATRPAAGLLHGVWPGSPADSQIEPLGLTALRLMPREAADLDARIARLGCTVHLVVSDAHQYHADRPWPGDGGDWTRWEAICAEVVEAARARGRPRVYDIWNEPDHRFFWPRDRDQFFQAWIRGARAVRLADPGAVIAGPSLADWDEGFMHAFLAATAAAGQLPDQLTWHEIDAWPGTYWLERFATARRLASAVGRPDMPIAINEFMGSPALTQPAAVARALSLLEEGGVVAAMRTTHPEPDGTHVWDRDTLCGLLDPELRTRPAWWVHRAYAMMSGRIAAIPGGLGLRAVDRAAGTARILLAGPPPGGLTVSGFRRVCPPPQPEARVLVRIERIPDLGWRTLGAPFSEERVMGVAAADRTGIELPPAANGDAFSVTCSWR